MKTLFFLLFTLSLSAQEVDIRVVTATVRERFINDGNTIITVEGKEYGKQMVVSCTFIVVDLKKFYKKDFEYVFKLKQNSGVYDFAYELLEDGVYSPRQTRIIINRFLQ